MSNIMDNTTADYGPYIKVPNNLIMYSLTKNKYMLPTYLYFQTHCERWNDNEVKFNVDTIIGYYDLRSVSNKNSGVVGQVLRSIRDLGYGVGGFGYDRLCKDKDGNEVGREFASEGFSKLIDIIYCNNKKASLEEMRENVGCKVSYQSENGINDGAGRSDVIGVRVRDYCDTWSENEYHKRMDVSGSNGSDSDDSELHTPLRYTVLKYSEYKKIIKGVEEYNKERFGKARMSVVELLNIYMYVKMRITQYDNTVKKADELRMSGESENEYKGFCTMAYLNGKDAKDMGRVEDSIKGMAHMFGMGDKTVSKVLGQLEEVGVLDKTVDKVYNKDSKKYSSKSWYKIKS